MRRRLGSEFDSQDFWPAFTDLISSVSLVLFIVMLLAIAQAAVSARFTIEGSKRVQEIFTKRAETTRKLVEKIGAGNSSVDDSAAIRFNSDVLFAYDSAELTSAAKQTVLPPVADALGRVLSDYNDSIDAIVIEGHTAGPPEDPDGYQWLLGARRAVAVLTFLQQQNPQLQDPAAGAKLAATSYSYYRPPQSAEAIPIGKCNDQAGECNQIRRIEIRVILRDEGLKDEIMRTLKGAE